MQHFLSHYGYWAIFIFMVLDSACIPIPSELTMGFGGALSSAAFASGRLSLTWVVVVGGVGNVVGSYLGWLIGRYALLPVVHRWGHKLGFTRAHVERTTRYFDEHGPTTVFLLRLVPMGRTFISAIAGGARMSLLIFGVYTIPGCFLWSAVLAYAGYLLGDQWSRMLHPATGVAVLVLLVGLAGLLYFVRRRPPDA